MRLHLVTIEAMEQFGEEWTITPPVPLGSLPPNVMMPMQGDAIELLLPDGRSLAAAVVRYGLSVWKADDGAFYTNADLSNPSLTLTITSDSDLSEIPPGTEIWLSDAKTSAESGAS